jgi:tetratricopeptide (TPR) repeat protein
MPTTLNKGLLCGIILFVFLLVVPVGAELVPMSSSSGESNQQAVEYFNQGHYYTVLNQSDNVIASYQKALEIDPNYTAARYNLLFAYYDAGRYEQAIATIDKLLEKSPEYPYIWGKRGDALVQLGRYNEAIESYNKDLKIRPNNFDSSKGRELALQYLSQNLSAKDNVSSQVSSPQATTTNSQILPSEVTSAPGTTTKKAPLIYAPLGAIAILATLSVWRWQR